MTGPTQFADRAEAGRVLAQGLNGYALRKDVIVLALPRGGVPVAFEIAQALGVPLDVFLVRKLGVPGYEDLAMGAIASGGITVRNEEVIKALDLSAATIAEVAVTERVELERRGRLYRGDRPPLDLEGKSVILVDDGLATGSTMRAAIAALRKRAPAHIVVAVPTSAPSTCEEIRRVADECHCAIMPDPFHAVGLWYESFSQVSDAEVCDLLERAGAGRPVDSHR